MADIKLSELVESVKKLSDEELQFADSGLRKMLAVVQQEIESREVKRKKERKNRKKTLDKMMMMCYNKGTKKGENRQ